MKCVSSKQWRHWGIAAVVCQLVGVFGRAWAAETAFAGDELRQEYFKSEIANIVRSSNLSNFTSRAQWEDSRQRYRAELQEMLGLSPWPDRTELKPVVTGVLERDDVVVEKLHFQAMPRVYVTGNLYRPKRIDKPLPTILYVCGHAHVVTNGVSYGNKTGYQHHGAWFARNGYVALLIDTVQLGEIEGFHHGTYRMGQWWWNSRGYTPAGVEAWFGIRALDYLCSRPDVDKDRIGMTGRSGGGSYTWTVAALDDRVKVAAPVAGVTDLWNQVVDGAIEGHCDCMFYLNSGRWDFPNAAALIAPRPLLIANSDKDSIFPLDGVVRLHNQVKRIYQLYAQTNQLGLLITDGPHADTQDLQVPVFRWFNRFLKQEQPLIEMAAKPLFSPQELRVFDKLPDDQLNTTVQDFFVPQAVGGAFRGSPSDLELLRSKVFTAWPQTEPTSRLSLIAPNGERGSRVRTYSLNTQPGVSLTLSTEQSGGSKPRLLRLNIVDEQSWSHSPLGVQYTPEPRDRARTRSSEISAWFAPRDVAPSRDLSDPKKAVQIRRRYMLLGTTVDSMRVWDILCAVRTLRQLPEFKNVPLVINASREMAVNAAYAALFEPAIARLELSEIPASHRVGPDYLNVMRYCDIPDVLSVLRSREVIPAPLN